MQCLPLVCEHEGFEEGEEPSIKIITVTQSEQNNKSAVQCAHVWHLD